MEKSRMRRRACSRPAGDREPQASGHGQGVDTISKRFQLRAFLLVLLVAACASPQPPTSMVSAPDKLKPGASESLAMIVPAKGVQIYECRARKDQAGGYEWAFVAPEANLFDARGNRIGRHYADAIPWLLLAATSLGSEGSFSKVASIQRVNTVGGVAPKVGCSQAAAGTPARLAWSSGESRVTGFEIAEDGRVWHLLAEPVEAAGVAQLSVDPAFRALQTELHTNTHVLNALVFQVFRGALITGAQLNDDGTARTDFDLPDVDNDRLRALEPQLNDVIRQDLPLRVSWVAADALGSEPGLIRCRSVAPPPASDGSVRVVEIVGLDRQACGGTHLASTGRSRAVRILKIDNKGRHNRRVKIGLVGP